MRVHIDASRALAHQPTGVNEYAREIIEHLAATAPNHTYILYAPDWLRSRAPMAFPSLPAKVQWRWLSWPPRFLWTQICLAWAWHRASVSAPDDIFFAPAHVAPYFSPRNLYVTVHDVAFDVLYEAYQPTERIFAHRMTARNIKQATRIFAISEETKLQLTTRYRVSADKIVVTPLALPCRVARAEAGELPAVLTNKTYILAVGRLEWKKGTDHLVRAFDRTAQRHDALLVLVGSRGVGYKKIERRINHSPYRTRMHELGYVTDATRAALYANAAACVVASRYEGFGMPVLEAFHFGVPVVARHASALPEVAGDAALWFSTRRTLGDAIEKILHDMSLRSALIAAGRERLKKYSWERTTEITASALGLL